MEKVSAQSQLASTKLPGHFCRLVLESYDSTAGVKRPSAQLHSHTSNSQLMHTTVLGFTTQHTTKFTLDITTDQATATDCNAQQL